MADSKRPNVVVLLLDDLGFADLGCYGAEISTPAIDRLAAGGIRYTNFHTTAMCSPTRASLLTGRQHHSVGMGIITEWSTEHPGYTGRITRRAATMAEMLGEHGYGTYAVGKWHIMPQGDASPAGPFDDWPLKRGFDRWYGFHGALADQWRPELFEDNHVVETPDDPGYHLTADLVDRSIDYLSDHEVNTPERPFFLYLATGAPHWPHQAPAEFIARYRGRYDRGWDVVRQERLERQGALGLVPERTELAPRNDGVAPWDELDPDRQRLFARMQEVYAAFVEHTDAQIGRLVEHLEVRGALDNTVIVLLSDNGASPEGGPDGAVNARKELVYEKENIDVKLASMAELGSDRTYNHYPWGWAQASNTPLKWYKKDVHGGGVRDPLIVHWPQRIKAGGSLRTQYHHVVDVLPTVLELVDVDIPEEYHGVPQMPVHGTSMVYTLDESSTPTRKKSQYFELLGDRALWRDGWKAVTRHTKGVPFDSDVWELYHLDEDFSEVRDLAEQHPDVLQDLVAQWWREAAANHVLPLDDREYERAAEGIAARARASTVLLPGMARLDRYHVPDITDRSYLITADVDVPPGATGVLLSVGSRFGGLVLHLEDGHLVFEYLYDTSTRWRLVSSKPIPQTCHELGVQFHRTGPHRGTATLRVDGEAVAEIAIPRTWPVAGLAGGLHCGRDGASPVSDSYTLPAAYTGTLRHVRVELKDDGSADLAAENNRAMAEQ